MVQHVLPIAGSVPESADELHQLAVEPVYVGFQDGTLALLLDLVFHLTPCLVYHFLNAGGVNPAVADELLQGDPGNLPAHMVKAGQGNGLRGIVDDEIHAGKGFQSPDVPALPADNSALHFVIGQRHNGNGSLGNLLRCAFCNGKGNIVPCLFVAFVLDLLLVAGNLQRLLVNQVILQHIEHIFLCLLPGQLGDTLQHIHFAFLEGFGLLEPLLRSPDLALELFFLPLQVVVLPVEIFFLLLDAALLPGNLSPAVLDLTLRLGAKLVDLVLGFHQCRLFPAVRILACVLQDALRFLLRRADQGFRLTPAVCNALLEENKTGNCRTDDQCSHTDQHCNHGFTHVVPSSLIQSDSDNHFTKAGNVTVFLFICVYCAAAHKRRQPPSDSGLGADSPFVPCLY